MIQEIKFSKIGLFEASFTKMNVAKTSACKKLHHKYFEFPEIV